MWTANKEWHDRIVAAIKGVAAIKDIQQRQAAALNQLQQIVATGPDDLKLAELLCVMVDAALRPQLIPSNTFTRTPLSKTDLRYAFESLVTVTNDPTNFPAREGFHIPFLVACYDAEMVHVKRALVNTFTSAKSLATAVCALPLTTMQGLVIAPATYLDEECALAANVGLVTIEGDCIYIKYMRVHKDDCAMPLDFDPTYFYYRD